MSYCVFFLTAIPRKPTGVTLLEAVKDCMVLGWTEPGDNGGADVRGYFVDYRTVKGGVFGKWHEMNHQAVTSCTYKVGLMYFPIYIIISSWHVYN